MEKYVLGPNTRNFISEQIKRSKPKITEQDLKKEIEHRITTINYEIERDDGRELVLPYCVVCGLILENKRGIVRLVHDIVYHYEYYVQQNGG